MTELGLQSKFCHVCHAPPGLGQCGPAFAREWAERNLTITGEWYVTVDDNVSGFTWLPGPEYWDDRMDFSLRPAEEWRKLYDTPCTPKQVQRVLHDTMYECQHAGTVFGGFAIETNYWFRSVKWQRLGYVRTQCSVAQNVGLPFYYWPGNMLEDFTRSVDVVARYGSVVVNRFMKPQKRFFEAGGIGSFEERRPNLVRVSQELMEAYPGLLRPCKGCAHQLTFALRSQNTVDNWRRKHGYLV